MVLAPPFLIFLIGFPLNSGKAGGFLGAFFGHLSPLTNPLSVLIAIALGLVFADYKKFITLTAIGTTITALIVIEMVNTNREILGLGDTSGSWYFFRIYGMVWVAHLVNIFRINFSKQN